MLKSNVSMVALSLLVISLSLYAQCSDCPLPRGTAETLELKEGKCDNADEHSRFSALPKSTSPADAATTVAGQPADTLLLENFVSSVDQYAVTTPPSDWPFMSAHSLLSAVGPPGQPADRDEARGHSKPSPVVSSRKAEPSDFNRDMYYKNKLEFSLDGGWLPTNIPFVFDVFLGDSYTMTDLKYTLVPVIASLRWQIDDVGGPWIIRGNWDLECSGAVTFVPRGPETRYIAWILGFRRNFVPRRGRIAPYFDGRVGLGNIDAKGPLGVLYAQGQNFTFTLNMGSGVRYNFSPRYSVSAGLNWMHISNLYLSQPKFANYGINVYGPMVGIDVRLGKSHRHASE